MNINDIKYIEDIARAWQQVREAIGSVECSQPRQLKSAMEQLSAARMQMEHAINRFAMNAAEIKQL